MLCFDSSGGSLQCVQASAEKKKCFAGDTCAANGALLDCPEKSSRLGEVADRFQAVHLHEGDEKKGENGKRTTQNTRKRRKNTILLMSLGKEGQCQFLGQPGCKDFARYHQDFAKGANNYVLREKGKSPHTLIARHSFLERKERRKY